MTELQSFLSRVDRLEEEFFEFQDGLDGRISQLSLARLCSQELQGCLFLSHLKDIADTDLLRYLMEQVQSDVGASIKVLCDKLSLLTENHNIKAYCESMSDKSSSIDDWGVILFTLNAMIKCSDDCQLDPALLFAFQLVTGDTDRAAETVLTLISTISNNSVASLSGAKREVNVTASVVAVQCVLQLVCWASTTPAQSVPSVGTTSHSPRSRSKSQFSSGLSIADTLLTTLRTQLSNWTGRFRALVPTISVAVRNAVTYSVILNSPNCDRYEMVSILLANPVSLSVLEELFTQLSNLNRSIDPKISTGRIAATNISAPSTPHSRAELAVTSPSRLPASAYDTTPQALAMSVKGDDGYDFLYSMSREDAIKTLYPLPEGSFLLRPHETLVEQFYLSFRTGHSGRSTIGKEAVVKHAIIRRMIPGRSRNNSASLNIVAGPTTPQTPPAMNFVGTSNKTGGNYDENASPLPEVLRSLTPPGDDSTQIAAADEEEVTVYSYQCGKIGPCTTMSAILREISDVLERPLKFISIQELQSTQALTMTPNARNIGGIGSVVGTSTTANLDFNSPIWEELKKLMRSKDPSGLGTFLTRKKLFDDTAGYVDLCKAVSAEEGLSDAWRIAEYPYHMTVLYQEIVKVLGLVENTNHLAPVIEMCASLAAIDCEAATDNAAAVKQLYENFSRRVDDDPYRSISSSIECDITSGFLALFSSCYRQVQKKEAALRSRLLPKSLSHSWYFPPLEFMVRRPSAGTTNVSMDYLAPNKPVFAPDDELLVAEHMLLLLTNTVGCKNVRLHNSNSSEHIVLKRCIDTEEVHKVVQLWWDLFVQHENALTQRQLAKRLSDKAKVSTKAGVKNGVENDLQELTQVDELSEYETNIVSRNTIISASTLSWSAYAILKRINSLLKIDLTCASKEYLRRLIAWLSDELQIICEITKPGDFAFSAVQHYYCPHHPFEVKVLRDFTQAGERVRLGRNVYCATAFPNSVSVVPSSCNRTVSADPKVLSTSTRTEASVGVGEIDATNTTQQQLGSNYFLRMVIPNLLWKPDISQNSHSYPSIAYAMQHLWNTLKVEEYIEHVLNSATEDNVREGIASILNASALSGVGSTTSKATGIAHSAYHATLEHYMYRNNCYSRLGLSQRAVPLVQVDIYGIQEILAVRVLQQAVGIAHTPVAIPSGVSPKTYISMFNKPTVLTPTSNTHNTAALDIYTVMQLTPRKSAHHSVGGANRVASYPSVKKSDHPLSAKYAPLGSVVTSVHKAEARRTQLEQNSPVIGTSSTTTDTSGVAHSSAIVTNTWYNQQKAGITRSTEYQWRDQALFRFPLPEGIQKTHLPPSTPDLQLFPAGEEPSNHYPRSTSGSTGTSTKVMSGRASSPLSAYTSSGKSSIKHAPPATTVPPVVLSIPESYFETPSILSIAVYERTFFSDTLLGELELDLAPVNGKTILRGWYPLTLDRSISWLIFLQVRLKIQELNIVAPAALPGPATATAVSTVQPPAVANGVGAWPFGTDDIFMDSARAPHSTVDSFGEKQQQYATSALSARIIKQMDDF